MKKQIKSPNSTHKGEEENERKDHRWVTFVKIFDVAAFVGVIFHISTRDVERSGSGARELIN